MERSAVGHATPEDIIAFISGEGDARAAAHIATCVTCGAEATAYGALERGLRSRLFRVDCPDPQILGELALQLLTPADELTVRQHLALCPHCAQELAEMGAALQGDPLEDLRPRPGPLARLVARLASAPGGAFAPMGIRGAGGGETRTYEADGLTVSLTIAPEGGGPKRRWTLLGLVIDESGDGAPLAATARALRAGELVAEAKLDELGNLTLTNLEAGAYDLEIVRDTDVVVVEGLEIGDAPV